MLDHDIFTEYGLWAIIIFMIIRDLAPAVVNRWFPQIVGQKGEQALKRLQMEQDQIKHQQDMEMRQVAAMERIAESLISLQLLVEGMNLRVCNIDEKVDNISSDVDMILDRTGQTPHRRAATRVKVEDAKSQTQG